MEKVIEPPWKPPAEKLLDEAFLTERSEKGTLVMEEIQVPPSLI